MKKQIKTNMLEFIKEAADTGINYYNKDKKFNEYILLGKLKDAIINFEDLLTFDK